MSSEDQIRLLVEEDRQAILDYFDSKYDPEMAGLMVTLVIAALIQSHPGIASDAPPGAIRH